MINILEGFAWDTLTIQFQEDSVREEIVVRILKGLNNQIYAGSNRNMEFALTRSRSRNAGKLLHER